MYDQKWKSDHYLLLLCWKYIKKNVIKNLGHCDSSTGLNIPLVKIQQPCLLSLAYSAHHRNLCNLFSLEISVIFRPKQIVSIFRKFYLTLLNLFSETFWWFLMYGFYLFSYLIIFLNHLAIYFLMTVVYMSFNKSYWIYFLSIGTWENKNIYTDIIIFPCLIKWFTEFLLKVNIKVTLIFI